MDERQTIVVTGVNGFWGRRVASRLLAQPAVRVIGLDRTRLSREPAGLDFFLADVRDASLGAFLRETAAHTVVHLAFRAHSRRREDVFDSNVLGTMNLLGACAEAGVRKVVLQSSTLVYGAHPDNPLYLPESWPLRPNSRHAFVRELWEIEKFVESFRADAGGMVITVLRAANTIGGGVASPLARLLALPVAPSVLGFDPLLQVIDSADVLAALVHAALRAETNDAVNLAGDGVVPLWKVLGIAGRPSVPVLHLVAEPGVRLLQMAGLGAALAALPFDFDYLRYSWVADNRRMREAFGFSPALTGEEALRCALAVPAAREVMELER